MVSKRRLAVNLLVAAVCGAAGLTGSLASPGDASAREVSANSMATWCTSQSKAVILGDSTATGYGTTGYPANGTGYVSTTNGWSATLAAQLSGTQFINLARNGALTSDFLLAGQGVEGRPAGPLAPDAIARIQTEQPSLVVVMLGANEYGTDRRPEQVYRANLQQLTNGIRAAAPDTSILFVHTWGFDYRWASGTALPIEYNWAQYEQVMREVAQAAGNTGYLDLTRYMPWADADTAGLFNQNEFGAGNPVHATSAGNWPVRAAIQGALVCS
jgi:acyl-CoA thioesterase I